MEKSIKSKYSNFSLYEIKVALKTSEKILTSGRMNQNKQFLLIKSVFKNVAFNPLAVKPVV